MRTILLLNFVLLGACAHITHHGYEYKLSLMVGQSEESLIGQWGSPDQVYKLSDEKKVLTYFSNAGSSGTSTYNPLTKQVYTRTSSRSCKTDFFLFNGVVRSSRWEGSACVAEEPHTDQIRRDNLKKERQESPDRPQNLKAGAN
jgi:hypothetical protein